LEGAGVDVELSAFDQRDSDSAQGSSVGVADNAVDAVSWVEDAELSFVTYQTVSLPG
jgi:hypothetical protein